MEASKNNNFKEYIYPVIILTVIALVSTLLLAITNNATAPVIAERAILEANATRQEVLPEADSFTEVTAEELLEDEEQTGTEEAVEAAADGDPYAESSDGNAEVTEVYQADDGSGYVFTCNTKSFGGNLTLMVGIGDDGTITGVVVTDHNDTPGVGTKDQTPEYLDQYEGRDELTSEDVKKEADWDYIAGASVSGTAIHKAVNAALEQYANIVGGEQ